MLNISQKQLRAHLKRQNARWTARASTITSSTEDKRTRLRGFIVDCANPDALLSRPNSSRENAVLPQSIDWRNVNNQSFVTSIKSQGSCSASVSFSIVAVLESMVIKQLGKRLDLSEADLHFGTAHGQTVNGWLPTDALNEVKVRGVADEACFPYDADSSICGACANRDTRAVKINDFTLLHTMRERKDWLVNNGPVCAIFSLYDDFFYCGSNVYRHSFGELLDSHAVAVIGYDDVAGCWICKNSWGILWGDEGFFRISYGECEIDNSKGGGFPFWGIQNPVLPALFENPRLAVANFSYGASGWRVDRHPRFLADISGDGRADIVGFGDGGVWVALSRGDGTFTEPQLVINNFAFKTGGWRVDRHPRFLADITGDGRTDIVGFGDGGVWVALSRGDGTFTEPQLVSFAFKSGDWRVDRHPRFLADITGDGRADIVGFGDGGVWVALSRGTGFTEPRLVINYFGYDPGAGDWRVDQHPRFLADITGDDRMDIVGFGNDGVWVALSRGDGTFTEPQLVIDYFGYNPGAGGWRVDRHPRFLADITGDGRADIVGFGSDGVWVALSRGDGTFTDPQLVINYFGYNPSAGDWRVDQHPRFLVDITGDGRADIVGFGSDGVWVALSRGDGTYTEPQLVINYFGCNPGAGEWRVDQHPRFLDDITGDGRADIVGFGNDGVWVARVVTLSEERLS